MKRPRVVRPSTPVTRAAVRRSRARARRAAEVKAERAVGALSLPATLVAEPAL